MDIVHVGSTHPDLFGQQAGMIADLTRKMWWIDLVVLELASRWGGKWVMGGGLVAPRPLTGNHYPMNSGWVLGYAPAFLIWGAFRYFMSRQWIVQVWDRGPVGENTMTREGEQMYKKYRVMWGTWMDSPRNFPLYGVRLSRPAVCSDFPPYGSLCSGLSIA